MPYCPKCDMEFVEGIKVCSDCGGPLVESKEVADAMKQKEKEEQLAVMAQEMDPFSGEMAKAEDADPDEISSAKKKPADEIVHAYVDKGQRYEDMSSSASAFFLVGAVTINPAEHIGIADRVGSLEEGKDADVVIVDGCPFDVTGVIQHVLINGEEV